MSTENKRTLIKIAHYYYNLGMTQEQIAKKLSMSRQKINRLISSLIQEGIVTITINGYENSFVELEDKLEQKFNLKDVIITSTEEKEDLTYKLGKAAAFYLESVATNNCIIGTSWGTTLSETANNLSKIKKNDISVVQLVGGINSKDISLKSDEITRNLANTFNGKSYLMYAPSLVKSKETRDIFMNEQSIKNTFRIIEKCDIALVGIGDLSKTSTVYKQNYLSEEEIEEVKNSKCIGDICLRMYDVEGNSVSTNLDDRIIGVSMDVLNKIPLVIAVAGGKDKTKAILGALRGSLIDVLITDNITAENILKYI
ncbi:sugar-binding transcriptional regulator [Clostridium aestuarii]|uniref:Sugar-binding transcriptional regulator n=1 Tax=Clostridium aestuarii TaxID=338193 RepID=A0ABT4D3H2_9CLOT|nr:sugar-binding transcriptional regulator [Clostridium aestuarii]MCY6485796.1 sugar-binding transcriptional regulator [Clostridium aestuarii]